jgi:hypothetical protein
MATFYLILPICPIPQMGQEDFASEGMLRLQGSRIAQCVGIQALEPAEGPRENVLNGSAVDGAQTADVPLSGRHIELDVRQTRSVLPTVVLFLHQEIHLVYAVESRSVFVDVKLEGLFEAKHGNAALVLKEITHVPGERGDEGD